MLETLGICMHVPPLPSPLLLGQGMPFAAGGGAEQPEGQGAAGREGSGGVPSTV